MTQIERAQGYRTDIDYVYDYHPELNPLRLRLGFLNTGLRPPEIVNACELGFGQGVSLAVHAAAAPVRWHGTDINPAHAAFARNLVAASGIDAGIFGDSFVEFAAHDLPEFDYIGLHGVWSWISDDNRTAIVDFVRRRLKPGGVLYLSYNALPGCAPFLPLRHLLVEHANRAGNEGSAIGERMEGALEFMEQLLATEPALIRETPRLRSQFAAAKGEDRRYLAHEYFNRYWQPMHFADLGRWLAPAGMSYACATDFSDHLDIMGLSAPQRRLMDELQDASLREAVKDLIANQRFRRDYWVRGATRLSATEQADALRQERIVAAACPLELPFKMKAALALGQLLSDEATCRSILELLADGTVWSLARIEQALQPKGISLDRIGRALVPIAGSGLIEAAQDDRAIGRARPHTDRLNAHLIAAARTSDTVTVLASPVIGGGIPVAHRELQFLSGPPHDQSPPDDWNDRLALLRALQVV